MTDQPDHYATLHVAPDATAREISRAYRSLLRTLHPDTRQGADDGGTTSAADVQELHAIMEAYVVLSDPRKRAAYDRARSGLTTRAAGTPVKVRFHSAPKPAAGNSELPPLSFGPPRWAPSSQHTRNPRSHS